VSGRDRVHGPDLDPVAAATRPRARLRLPGDLLAAADRVGQRRRLDQLHLVVLDRLGEQGRLDWSRASVDSASVRAKRRSDRGQVASIELASRISGSAAKTSLAK
jgi:hypothetical protein